MLPLPVIDLFTRFDAKRGVLNHPRVYFSIMTVSLYIIPYILHRYVHITQTDMHTVR